MEIKEEYSFKMNEMNMNLKEEEIKGLKKKNKFNDAFNAMKLFAVLVLIGFEFCLFYFLAGKYGIVDSKTDSSVKVAVLNVNKTITSDYINDLTSYLEKIKYEKSYKKLIVVMNSPGGSPTASDEFSEYLKDFQKHKEVIMYVEGMAASGGYYIASSIKPLLVNQNAILGSIGVIMPKYTIKGLAEKLGVNEDNITEGKYKAPISMFENVDEEGKKYLKEHIMTPMYDNFVNIISKNRGIDKEIIKKYAEGQIFLTSYQGIEGILYDKVTNLISIKNEINNELKTKNKIKIEDIVYEDLNKNNKINKFLDLSLNIESDTLKNILE